MGEGHAKISRRCRQEFCLGCMRSQIICRSEFEAAGVLKGLTGKNYLAVCVLIEHSRDDQRRGPNRVFKRLYGWRRQVLTFPGY